MDRIDLTSLSVFADPDELKTALRMTCELAERIAESRESRGVKGVKLLPLPPNAVLIYELTLVSVHKGVSPGAGRSRPPISQQ